MRSMTGFGRGTAAADGNHVAIEICAVNSRRQADIRLALPESEQDALAAAIRAEMEADAAWERLLSVSGEALEILADEAVAEHRSGRARPLDPTER